MFEMTHFQVTKRRRMLELSASQVDFFRANGNYVDLFSRGEKYLHRATMGILEQGLPNQMFLRIHRSWIVNVHFIRQVQYQSNGEYRFVFKDGTEVVSGRAFKPQVLNFLNRCEHFDSRLQVWQYARHISAA